MYADYLQIHRLGLRGPGAWFGVKIISYVNDHLQIQEAGGCVDLGLGSDAVQAALIASPRCAAR